MVSAVEKAETGEWFSSVPWKGTESTWWPARSYTAKDRSEKVDKPYLKLRPPSAASTAEMEWRKKLDAAKDAGFDSALEHELCMAKLRLHAMRSEVCRQKMSLVSRLLSEHLCAVSWVSFDALRISGRNLKRRVRCSE